MKTASEILYQIASDLYGWGKSYLNWNCIFGIYAFRYISFLSGFSFICHFTVHFNIIIALDVCVCVWYYLCEQNAQFDRKRRVFDEVNRNETVRNWKVSYWFARLFSFFWTDPYGLASNPMKEKRAIAMASPIIQGTTTTEEEKNHLINAFKFLRILSVSYFIWCTLLLLFMALVSCYSYCLVISSFLIRTIVKTKWNLSHTGPV